MNDNNYYVTMTSKGQVTMPANIRNKLHLTSGNKIEFILQDDCMIIIPINNSISRLKGILPRPAKALTCEEMDEAVRSYYDSHCVFSSDTDFMSDNDMHDFVISFDKNGNIALEEIADVIEHHIFDTHQGIALI